MRARGSRRARPATGGPCAATPPRLAGPALPRSSSLCHSRVNATRQGGGGQMQPLEKLVYVGGANPRSRNTCSSGVAQWRQFMSTDPRSRPKAGHDSGRARSPPIGSGQAMRTRASVHATPPPSASGSYDYADKAARYRENLRTVRTAFWDYEHAAVAWREFVRVPRQEHRRTACGDVPDAPALAGDEFRLCMRRGLVVHPAHRPHGSRARTGLSARCGEPPAVAGPALARKTRG